MQPVEKNPLFTNKLIDASSPYLRQHAHNPVLWYSWGDEALARARAENKPILLSIGYSTCYWCHVMEREVFENLSIASLMNRHFINIKIDREEHPELDEIYMVARQLITREGGWPNNVFLTPDLKPFYAGGTYAADDHYGKPAFPRLLEWLNHRWTSEEDKVRQSADELATIMQEYLIAKPPAAAQAITVAAQAEQLFSLLEQHYDGRAGGFFQAPKFPHEAYVQFLLNYHLSSANPNALDMAAHTLGQMAAGGLQDQVGCGFHRYAVDKDWQVPHFEKMLYTQALLSSVYIQAAGITGSPYLADVAKSILDFVSGPFTDGNGAFYSAFDAETDGVEGAYYAWTAKELQALLSEEETAFFLTCYALADIPTFPGHKETLGQVIIARAPLAAIALKQNLPYLQVAAMNGQVMNKLLAARNQRPAPRLDDKIIVAWNGLMIASFAQAGKQFAEPRYTNIARRATDFLLEHAIDNDGMLKRIIAGGHAQQDATLEDYAYLAKGVLDVCRAEADENLLDAAMSLCARVEDLFQNSGEPGYYMTQASDTVPFRVKNGDDSALPNPNAVMLHNWVDLYEITGDEKYLQKAFSIADFFLSSTQKPLVELATMVQGALRLPVRKIEPPSNVSMPVDASNPVQLTASLLNHTPMPGEPFELRITLTIKEGWSINAQLVNTNFLIPTQIDVRGQGVELLGLRWPEAQYKQADTDDLLVFTGTVVLTARLTYVTNGNQRPPITVTARFQPCQGQSCQAVQNVMVTI